MTVAVSTTASAAAGLWGLASMVALHFTPVVAAISRMCSRGVPCTVYVVSGPNSGLVGVRGMCVLVVSG